MADTMGRWLGIHGGWHACHLRGSAVNSATADPLEKQVGLSEGVKSIVMIETEGVKSFFWGGASSLERRFLERVSELPQQQKG